MSKLLLANFKKETGIEITKDKLISLRDIYLNLEINKKDNLTFNDISEKEIKKLLKNFSQFTEFNLTKLKFDGTDEYYFTENKDYIIRVEGGKTKPFINYYVTKRTAEIILGRSKTKLGKEIMNKLFDLFHNLEDYKHARYSALTNYRPMTDAIKALKEPDDKFYHYSNEADLLNRIVTGLSSKKFKEIYGVESARDALTPEQLLLMDKLQIQNTAMIDRGIDYETRKQELQDFADKKIIFLRKKLQQSNNYTIETITA